MCKYNANDPFVESVGLRESVTVGISIIESDYQPQTLRSRPPPTSTTTIPRVPSHHQHEACHYTAHYIRNDRMPLTPDQGQYLRDHSLAVLGTGRRDGSPQLSMIIYDYNGEDLVISVTSDRAKWKNSMRQPNVALLIPDGRRQLIVYGAVTGIETDPDRSNGTKRIRVRAGRPFEGEDADLIKELDEANRVILNFTPDHAFMTD
jgi:hypothetical protein